MKIQKSHKLLMGAKKVVVKGLVLSMLFTTILLSGCSQTASLGDSPVELSLAHFFPATHPAEKELVEVWGKKIEEATDGKVVITSYPGETLLDADDTYSGVVDGIADIGLSCFSYNKGRFPVSAAFEQPGIVYKNSKVASMVAWEGIKKLNPEEVQDTKLLMVIATGPGDIFSKSPVNDLEDLDGMQIRATGLTADTLELLGASPVGMPQSEAYEALSRGMVAGNLAPIEVLQTWNHADVTDYITQTPFLYNNLFYITMNLDTWDSLSTETQDIIVEISENLHKEDSIALWDRQNEVSLDWAVNEKGMELMTLSDEETQKWIELVKPLQEKYVSQNGEKAKEALETAKELAEKYNEKY
ncbi:TRAP transporter substrate-binding protein [Herbivorax sp. ANBcel31]|uniref:TRAP transporter substrate-binding protein n=1 Tax=Herbivorax sp. ANBcel31 TaxID=3069754 RepID=UPI0027B40B2D|nr:TRAP transporter substrate-binding protein [Herbivorax sp. ANBcel31]MDQ2086303.1 TRAP transporter substrate-binding protein [Herbivorax sp. ANBcel31]